MKLGFDCGGLGITGRGRVELLPSIVMVARSISSVKPMLFVHVHFKFVIQVGEILDSESMGVVHASILCMRGIQREPVETMEWVPGFWKYNVCGVHEGCCVSTGVGPLNAHFSQVGFDFIEMDRVGGMLQYE